ncbi:pyridoxamine 5'-phosphate oxidase [Cerasicoccus maritimus]|uniref:pyridoxamine 5'-phosphate oxidase n=1 Tax=Cerasicoccus maritimus TaxID=490089 RepID=UPI002852A256|nr:pyridoxamine 5'-phosphate oxidase [Cerasicoccus maritimus]
MTDPADMRREYTQAGLSEENALADPIAQFRLWFEQALAAQLVEPNAMTLSTVDAYGAPDSRTVLLKAYDERGFVFFTNYHSAKAGQIEKNPRVSLQFPWLGLERQVKIRGAAEKISTKDSLKYFLSRPRGSQLGAWVSHQSTVISNRSILEMKLAEMKRKFGDGEIPLPDFWGGYRVVPALIEFWQGRPSRLHDRLQYSQNDVGEWQIERLAP